ncbi:nucleotide sugar dehydrogenase [Candidatus Nomurabacteria bacterium]|nr:nucleotide sugar dehydrogenase [Candidatus Nomurabacteria bacterium]
MVISNKVVVVGLGYVGLPLALLAERKGHKVTGVDTDQSKIDLLKNKKTPFTDEMVTDFLPASKIELTTEFSCVKNSEIIIICVPTPVYENHLPNLELVINASTKVAEQLQKGQLIILESTVNPEVSESVVLPILEEVSGLKGGTDFYLAHAPERINPGDPKWNVENINRVVGSFESVGLEKAVAFYESILTGTVKRMGSLKEAEAVKVVENSFRDINIAFVNELARSFTRLGIDIVNVIDGAATKPFAFMAHYPGCGVGGHCIPVDPYYLIEHAKKKGFDHDFLSLARRINNDMPHFTVERVIEGLNDVKMAINGSVVTVLGVSYKANIDDCRESPSFEIIKLLKAKGAEVRIYDPFVERESNVTDLESALKGANAVVLATAHKEFKTISPETYTKAGVKVMVDGRNALPKNEIEKAGIIYKGIGR